MSRFSRITPLTIALDFRYILLTIRRVAFPTGQHLGVKKAVNFVLRQDFIEKYFAAFFLLLRLAALQYAVFVGPNQRHFTHVPGEICPQCLSRFLLRNRV